MPRLNIKVTVINDEETQEFITNAIIQDEILKYKERDNTTVIYDYKNNSLFRENNELRMDYSFNSGKGNIFIKGLNKKLNIKIKTKKIERKINIIEIEYVIENNNFLYKVEEIK